MYVKVTNHKKIEGKRKERTEGKREREREGKHKRINYTIFALPLAPFCGRFLLRTRITVLALSSGNGYRARDRRQQTGTSYRRSVNYAITRKR